MICNNCKIQKVCKNYDYLTNHTEISIDKCDLYISNASETNNLIENIKALNPTNLNLKLNEGGESPFNVIPIDIKEKPITKKIMVECPTCGTKVFKDNIKECSDCGKETCPNCGIDVFECITEKNLNGTVRYCNECYGIEDDDIDKVQISFKDLLNKSLLNNKEEGE